MRSRTLRQETADEEAREDFRNFRVDRIAELAALERRYPDQPGRRLADFLRAMQAA